MATKAQTVLKGVSTKLNANPFTRSGYEFLGWSRDKTATSPEFADTANCSFTGNTTLFAIWRSSLQSWTISYNMSGHGEIPSQAKRSYSPENLPYVPPAPKNIYDPDMNKSWLFQSWTPSIINVGETGNKTFSANWYEASEAYPGFLQVCILDTSGSMSNTNYLNSAAAITEALLEYTCQEVSFTKIRIFHGTYITNVQEDESQFIKNFDLSRTSYNNVLELSNMVWPEIYSIPKNGSSEAMITCFYYAIGKTMQSIDSQTIGSSSLKSVNFLMLTDEDLFNFDKRTYIDNEYFITSNDSSLKGYHRLIGYPDSGDYDESSAVSPWFANWQKNTFGIPEGISPNGTTKKNFLKKPDNPPNWDSRFPAPNFLQSISATQTVFNRYNSQMTNDITYGNLYNDTNIGKTQAFIDQITNVFKQMSYYYGIIFTWSYYLGIASRNDKKATISNKIISIVESPKLTKMPTDPNTLGWHSTGSGSSQRFDYINIPTKSYNIPSSYSIPVKSISEQMIQVIYIGCDIKSSRIMTPSDKYNATSAREKIHYVNEKYFQFKFNGEAITLPPVSDVVNANANFKWKLVGSGTEYNPGGSYTVDGENYVIFAYTVSS